MDLEKKNDSSAISDTAMLAKNGECPLGDDPMLRPRSHYTFGIPNATLGGMILVTLPFAALAAFLLLRQNPETPLLLQSVSVVWTVSLLVCSYLSLWTYTLSRTMGAAAIFFRVSYGALLAFTAGSVVGPATGMATVHLNTAWAAGLLGYSLAEHRLHNNRELAANEAAARTPSSRSEGQRLTVVHTVFTSSLVTLFLASRLVWLVFFPSHRDENVPFIVLELSVLVWMVLYFWAMLATKFLLHEALVSVRFMLRIFCCFIASNLCSVVCALVSQWLFVYYFGVEMMAMAAFFGYILAVHACCKERLLGR